MGDFLVVLHLDLKANEPREAARMAAKQARGDVIWTVYDAQDANAPHKLPLGLGDYFADGTEAT